MAPPIRNTTAYPLMIGVMARTHVQARTEPVGRCASKADMSTGDKITNTETTAINGSEIALRMCAVFRSSNRYTLPCASGYPPSNAPATYQAFVKKMEFPNRVTLPSSAVPIPYATTPAVHHKRCGPVRRSFHRPNKITAKTAAKQVVSSGI